MLVLSIVVITLIVLYFLGVHVAAVLGVIALGLMALFSDRPLWEMTGLIAWNVGTTNVLVAVPMFILMGELLLRGGLTERMYRCFTAWFHSCPGAAASPVSPTRTPYSRVSERSSCAARPTGTQLARAASPSPPAAPMTWRRLRRENCGVTSDLLSIACDDQNPS